MRWRRGKEGRVLRPIGSVMCGIAMLLSHCTLEPERFQTSSQRFGNVITQCDYEDSTPSRQAGRTPLSLASQGMGDMVALGACPRRCASLQACPEKARIVSIPCSCRRGHTITGHRRTIARGLKVPVASIPPEEAFAHFGRVGAYAGLNLSASSAITRHRLGWLPGRG